MGGLNKHWEGRGVGGGKKIQNLTSGGVTGGGGSYLTRE